MAWLFFDCVYRFRTSINVQRRECSGEPSLGGGLQAPAGRQLRHLRQPEQEAAPVLAQDGHRHGAGHGHVQAHESPGRPEDHGGNQEGGRLWRLVAGQLH